MADGVPWRNIGIFGGVGPTDQRIAREVFTTGDTTAEQYAEMLQDWRTPMDYLQQISEENAALHKRLIALKTLAVDYRLHVVRGEGVQADGCVFDMVNELLREGDTPTRTTD